MKLVAIIFATFAVIQLCTAAPQGDPEDEVELVPATNTNQRDPESGFPFLGGGGGSSDEGFPVIIVRTSTRGRNPLRTLLNDFFGDSGSTGEEETIIEENIPEVPISSFPDLKSILGFSGQGSAEGGEGQIAVSDDSFPPGFPSIFSNPTTDDKVDCGLICNLLKGFDTQLKQIEEEVREIRDKEKEKENEIFPAEDGESNGPVNEYTEEVLPDGTIIRTNKTYSTSEDGSSYFSFQSTSVNHFGNSAEPKPEVKIENDGNENADVDSLDEDTVSDQETANKEFEDTEEREELDENVGVDEGLFNA